MKIIIILLVSILAFVGCDDNYLEEVPKDFTSVENFFRNEDDAVAAVNSVYASFLDIQSYRFFALTELSTETTTSRNIPNAASHFSALDDMVYVSPATYNLYFCWLRYYQTISRANYVLANVGDMDESKFNDTSLKDRVIGEAYFMRALNYFYLVRFFGGVPLRINYIESVNDAENIVRNTEAEVYNQIIADLEEAISRLPQGSTYSGSDIGRASQGAAKALLAKVYLQRGSICANNGITGDRLIAQSADFQKTASYCQEVIDSGEYGLVACEGLWGFDAIDNNGEIIFRGEHSLSNITSAAIMIYRYVALLNANFINASEIFTSQLDFYKEFSSNDIRKSVIFYTQYVKNGNTIIYNIDDPANDGFSSDTPTYTKYLEEGNNPYGTDDMILRYADVLLMKAEALNEVNNGPTADAYNAINQVRNRAGLDDLAGLSYTDFKKAVYIERQKEFVMEGHGWFDSQRYFSFYKERQEASSGYTEYRFGPSVKVVLQDPKHRLMPIPQTAIDYNPLLEQNPGW